MVAISRNRMSKVLCGSLLVVLLSASCSSSGTDPALEEALAALEAATDALEASEARIDALEEEAKQWVKESRATFANRLGKDHPALRETYKGLQVRKLARGPHPPPADGPGVGDPAPPLRRRRQGGPRFARPRGHRPPPQGLTTLAPRRTVPSPVSGP